MRHYSKAPADLPVPTLFDSFGGNRKVIAGRFHSRCVALRLLSNRDRLDLTNSFAIHFMNDEFFRYFVGGELVLNEDSLRGSSNGTPGVNSAYGC